MSSMQPLDNEFFEEYKRLDRLCADMYSCKNGVSQYIEDMESRSRREAGVISSWDNDYKMLKHLRWKRNRIAHDTDGHQISSISDIQYVRKFHERILSGQDPIALLEKSKVAAGQQENMQYEYRPAPQRSFDFGCLIIIVDIVVILLYFLTHN